MWEDDVGQSGGLLGGRDIGAQLVDEQEIVRGRCTGKISQAEGPPAPGRRSGDQCDLRGGSGGSGVNQEAGREPWCCAVEFGLMEAWG